MPQEQFSNVLPEDFDGVFRFTNPSEEDFVGTWGGVAYLFPAQKTTPMFIRKATPEEVQNIRKKFAQKLAEREFFKSDRAKKMESTERVNNMPQFGSINQAMSYDINELAPYIQKCLEPLPQATPMSKPLPKENTEEMLTKDEEGNLRTEVMANEKVSLKQKAREAKG